MGTTFIQPVYDSVHRACQYARAYAAPCENPGETLKKISTTSYNALSHMGCRPSSTEEFEGALRRTAKKMQNELFKPEGAQKTAEDTTNWHKEIEKERETLTRQLTVFTAISLMTKSIKMDAPDEANILNLVKEATGENKKSIWTLFVEAYKPSFWQKVSAFFSYWIYYRSSIIENTIQAYLGAFIEKTVKDLTDEKNQTRSYIFSQIIKNAKEFFDGDERARRLFLEQKTRGSLEEHQNREIQAHYNFSLSSLCKEFSRNRVDEDTPNVEFFSRLKKIPILGYFFVMIEALVNRLFIRNLMKYTILPSVLETTVEGGLEKTAAHQLPFAIARMRFLKEQLEKFLVSLKSANISRPPQKIEGTELLPSVVKDLLRALSLENYKSVSTIQSKLEELQTANKSGKEFEEQLEKAIMNGGFYLFQYLNEEAQKGALIATGLKLASQPFSGEARSQESLTEEYASLEDQLNGTIEEVVQEVIRQVTNEITGNGKGYSKPFAEKSFHAKQGITAQTVLELQECLKKMKEKFGREDSSQVSFQEEAATSLRLLELFSSNETIVKNQSQIAPVDLDITRRALNPLFTRLEKYQSLLLKIEKLDSEYFKRKKEQKDLDSLSEHLKVTGIALSDLAAWKEKKEQIEKMPASSYKHNLQKMFQESEEAFLCAAKANWAIETLNKLEDPQLPPEAAASNLFKGGLIDQLIAGDQVGFSQYFGLRNKRGEIIQTLEKKEMNFSPLKNEEKEEILRSLKNGKNLNPQEIKKVLFKIRTSYQERIDQAKESLNKNLSSTVRLIEENNCEGHIEHTKKLLTEKLEEADLELQNVLTNTLETNISIPSATNTFTTNGLGALAASVGGCASYYLSSSLTFAASISGLGFGLIKEAFQPHRGWPEKSSSMTKALKTLAPAALGLSLSLAPIPAPVQIGAAFLGSTLTGKNSVAEYKSEKQNEAYDKILGIWEQCRGLFASPRIYTAAVTRLLKEMAKKH